MLQEKQYRREVAKKASIAGILSGEFLESEDGTTALNANGVQIKRVNILATIVNKTEIGEAYKSMVADDGTGQIKLQVFDDAQQLFGKAEVGDFALIIGKPRAYGSERYIAPELIKVLKDTKWAEARKLELKTQQAQTAAANENATKDKKTQLPDDMVSKGKVEVYQAVKELDKGRGADMTEVAAKCGNNAEALIKEMTKAGDLFEVSPGRLKVLE
ncbi:hypothetical protein HYU40_01070 [Candidatus Woesearchaeota archaeon]|nr:hypothetical protein [Candidatus Woesearchaeota archaeon]